MNATTTTPQTTTANRVNNKIEDFGQKIGGARKDWFANMREAAQKFAEVGAVDLVAAPLSKVVALPNLEKMTEAGALTADRARAALTIWRKIETRPAGSSYALKRWAEKTAPQLARIGALLNGAEITEDERAAVDFLILTAANWPAESFTFGRVKTGRTWGGSYLYATASNRYIAKSENAADIVAAIRQQCEKDAQRRAEGVRLAVCYNRAGEYFVTPEHKTEIILFKGERAECYDKMNNHADELRARYAEIKSVPELRRDWNRPRVGEDWRKGEDITPETFGEVLPFRGVEFGNWVTQAERASLLNSAFDGFHDLAQMLGVSVERVTLGGSLAFAFASRGISKAMAHYEPGRKVINLTKKNGAGCMAHEWFHACDNWAANLGGLHSSAMATERDTQTDAGRCALAISRAIESTEFYTRSRNMARVTSPYWVEPCELAARGFEGVAAYLLKRSGVCSDFLVNCLSMDEFTKADTLHRSDVYPYPSEAEAAALAPYYLNFFRALFGEGAELTAEQWADINAQQAKAEAERAEAEAKRAEAARQRKAEQEAKAKAEREARDQKRAELLAKHRDEVPAMKAKAEAEGVQNVATLATCSGAVVAGLLGGFIVAYWTEYGSAEKFAVLGYKHNGRLRKGARVHRYDIESAEKTAAEYFESISKADEMAGYYVGAPAIKDVTAWGQDAATFADLLSKAKEAQRKADERKAKAETAPRYESAEKSEGAEVLAEADGVQLVKMGEGVAIIEAKKGATFRNRKEIRANGGDWNKTAKQWQAVAAEDVARLCEWFGVSADEQTAPTAQEVAEGERIAWQYTSNEGEQLHEIRRTPSGFFSITWNICEENGGGIFDATHHKTHADALATLQAFRPGVKPYEPTEPQPTAPTEGGEAETTTATADTLQDAEEISENGESSVIWHNMELTEHEAEHAEKLLTLLSRGVVVSFITSKGEKYEAKPTAKGCIFARPYGTTYGETLEDVAAMLAQHTANDPAGHFKAEQPTESAPKVEKVAEVAQPAERPHVITFSAEDCPELPELTEPTAPTCEAVAESPRYGVAEKLGRGGAFGVFSFSVLGLNSGAPELLTTMPNEGAACLFLSNSFAGCGAVSLDSVEVLARGGDWWVIYYSKRNGDVICDYVAPSEGVGDLSGALTNADAWNLREQLADQWAHIIAREEGAQIATLTEGAEYAAEYKGERVTVKPDTMNAGRYVVAWWCGDSMKEQNTDRTAEEAAEAVAMFAAYCVPFRIWNRGRNLSRITRPEVKRAAAF